jgi:hypothetical protein
VLSDGIANSASLSHVAATTTVDSDHPVDSLACTWKSPVRFRSGSSCAICPSLYSNGPRGRAAPSPLTAWSFPEARL